MSDSISKIKKGAKKIKKELKKIEEKKKDPGIPSRVKRD